MNLLAEIPTPPPGSTETWLWVFAAVLGIALLVKQLFHRQPSIEAEFATKGELREVEAKMDGHIARIETRIDDKLTELDLKRSRQVAALHEDNRSCERMFSAALRDLQKQISELAGQLKH